MAWDMPWYKPSLYQYYERTIVRLIRSHYKTVKMNDLFESTPLAFGATPASGETKQPVVEYSRQWRQIGH